MEAVHRLALVVLAAAGFSLAACGNDDDDGTASDADSDADTDGDTDGDSDTDTDLESSLTECAGGKLDPATNLCWQDPPMDNLNEGCEELDLGGYTDWRVPNIEELISLIRGCVDGTATGDLSPSTCTMPDGCVEEGWCGDPSNCGSCDSGSGPGTDGCYLDPALAGGCSFELWWSSTLQMPDISWCINFRVASVIDVFNDFGTYGVRCVRSGP